MEFGMVAFAALCKCYLSYFKHFKFQIQIQIIIWLDIRIYPSVHDTDEGHIFKSFSVGHLLSEVIEATVKEIKKLVHQ